jgi:hypothetical protein
VYHISFFQDGVTPDNLISSVENLHQMVGSIFKSSVTNLQELAGNENILKYATVLHQS